MVSMREKHREKETQITKKMEQRTETDEKEEGWQRDVRGPRDTESEDGFSRARKGETQRRGRGSQRENRDPEER